jgi:hypothetical protein
MITKEIIENRIKNWWGYGSFEAPVWFVGMEEGLGGTQPTELENRFLATDGKITMDIRKGMETVPLHIRALDEQQPLWDYQIALYLYLKNGTEPKQNERSDYQKRTFANIDVKETACIDLMPLPSRGTKESDWFYAKYDDGNLNLESRSRYLKKYKTARVEALKELINEHKPKVVIFCSLGYLRTGDWAKIIGENPKEITNQMFFSKRGETAYCVIPQPHYLPRAYERLYEFADKIKEQITF